jgi:hypothetical protein
VYGLKLLWRQDLVKSSRAFSPDDEDGNGSRNVGSFYACDAADCPRRLY